MTRSALLVVVCALVLGAIEASARADDATQPIAFGRDVPADALGWWRFDPRSFPSTQPNAQREVMVGGLRAAVGSGLFGDRATAMIVEALLAASVVGEVPHTLVLHRVEASRTPPLGDVEIAALSMVLVLHTSDRHEAYLRTIRAMLVEASRSKQGALDATQRVVDLPGGASGVAYRESAWGAWREVAWTSYDDAFVIALGTDALRTYVEAVLEDAADRRDGAWAAHDAVVDDARPDGPRFFSAFLDLDGLRTGFPDGFVIGRPPRVLRVLRLQNAAQWMVQGRFVDDDDDEGTPPMMAIDSTSRGSRDGGLDRLEVSAHAWPGDGVSLERPGGSYALAIPLEWPAFFELSLEMAQAFTRGTELLKFRQSVARWRARNDEALGELFEGMRPWLIVSDDPPPVLPVPGLATLFVEWDETREAGDVEKAFGVVMADFSDVVSRGARGMWSLRIDRGGMVRLPAWGFHARPGGGVTAVGASTVATAREAAETAIDR